ncbi:baseplate assembly protein [uncultured Roseibium sp.]|uniref:baseplate assembly protein n=1 Tax=uncultured Roseibium sp. TaxID=1936171 RepID=UPI0026179353|nr:baseplate assembly protein [uncultured Roseibium sp.]
MLVDLIAGQRIDLEQLKTKFGHMIKVGPIEVVDAVKGYRIKLGEGEDGPFLSPWLPHPESGGQSSSWVPLSEGQIVAVLSPNGDMRQGALLRNGFTDGNPQPSDDLKANFFEAFDITISMKDGTLKVKGDIEIEGDVEITGNLKVTGDIDFRGGYVKHNDTAIDDTHLHGGVVPGGANTDVPVG